MGKYYTGLDIGTTGIKAVIFDADGRLAGSGLAEYTLETPAPDIVELDAEIYWQSSCAALKIALDDAGIAAEEIISVAITGQVETLVFTDAAGHPVRKAIVWLDNRAKDEAKEIEAEFGQETLFRLSGQTEMLPCWPAAKILWLRRNEPEVFARTAKYLMVEDFIIHRLTGDFTTCRGLLPSTLYFDIRTGEYDTAMTDYLGITAEQLPDLKDCGEYAGTVVPNDSILPAGAVIAAAPLDHICGNLGSGCAGEGMISETTGCTLALCAAFPELVYDSEKRISTYLGAVPGTYVLLPWAPTAGMLLKHFRDEFCAGMSYADFDNAAAEIVPGCDGLLLLPHCAGSVSPVCNPEARGVAYGITLAHKRGHWARAIMESVAYLLRDNIEVLRSLGAEVTSIRALGGATKSKLWLQIMADVIGLPVTVTECEEATGLGAAILGAVVSGGFADAAEAAEKMVHVSHTVYPGANTAVYDKYFKDYQKLNSILMPTFGGKL